MKNSSDIDYYHTILKEYECESIVIDQKGFDLLKNSLEFAVNSSRTLYYICNIKELVTVLKKRALPDAVEKEAFESILEFVRTKNDDKDPAAFNELPFRVLDVIATEIGHKWLDLARHLNVSDNTIEEIETRYPNQLKQRAYQALLIYSKEGNRDDMKLKLLEALTKSRRVDLRAKVEREFQEMKVK